MDKLNAFITLCGDSGIAIKDNFCTKGIKTTAASKILKDFVPPYDATVVEKLKLAGFKIMGKTNMDAFAHGSSTETSDFGVTRNPWDLERVAGGSSGGSAAAVAAGMCEYAIGSETAGSIRGPAAWCGVVGFKPTYGRVSRYGLIAMCSSTDCPGPIARTVEGVRKIYDLIKGIDPKDATTSEGTFKKFKSLKGLKIGLPKQYFWEGAQQGMNETILKAAKKLEEKGAILKEFDVLDLKYAIAVYTVVQRAEVSSNLARFDGIRFGQERSLFNAENRRRIMLGAYILQSGYYDAYYLQAQKVRTLIINDFNKAFQKFDILLAPTMPTVAPKIGVTSGQAMYGELADVFTEPTALAGLPAISVPGGFLDGLPVGMQLIGPMWSEDYILDVAQIFEESTDWHKQKPKL